MCCCCNRNATVAIASAVLYWKPLFAQLQHGSISVRAYAAAAHVHDVRILLLYCCLLSAMIALQSVHVLYMCISNSAFLSAYSYCSSTPDIEFEQPHAVQV